MPLQDSAAPSGPVIDAHDLAAIILHAHATVAGAPFARSKLLEVSRDGAPFYTLTDGEAPEGWFIPGVATPNARELTRKELEDIYWRCKDHNEGSQLAYVAQCAFDLLTASTTRVRARTSTGYELVFDPTELRVGTATITPREAFVIMYADGTDDRRMSCSGFDGPIPWSYLVLGNPADLDRCVVLDLALPQIGGRGLGGELFALERHDVYQTRVLPKYAQVHHVKPDLTCGIRLFLATDEQRARVGALTEAIAERLVELGPGDNDFCRYCGAPGIITRCGVCKTYFCEPCHKLAWKYHKVWCTPFRY